MASPTDPFIWTPENNIVKELNPKYAFLRTPADSPYKIQRQLLDPVPLQEYELDFGEIFSTGSPTGMNRNSIKAHYDAQIEDYYAFYWNSVPAYISLSAFQVRYSSYEEEPLDSNGSIRIYKLKIVLSKVV
jgi:hypothetical protein